MKNKIVVSIMPVLIVALLASCSNIAVSGDLNVETVATAIEMEMDSHYDDFDPFINEKLIFISDDVENVGFDVSFQMVAESGLLEIADNETKEVIWSKSWNEHADEKFSFSLSGLDKEKEYVIRLTCTKVENTKLVITSDSSLVKERERPLKPDKE